MRALPPNVLLSPAPAGNGTLEGLLASVSCTLLRAG
jgi:hypothetical protein